jgi:hypothetical protein
MSEQYIRRKASELLNFTLDAHSEVNRLPTAQVVDLDHVCGHLANDLTPTVRGAAHILSAVCQAIVDERNRK